MPIRRAALGMSIVSATALAFEVALTRICSALLQYHLSFAVVSMAVLGIGLGGFVAYAGTRRAPHTAGTWAHGSLIALPLGIVLALTVLLRLPFARWWPFLLFLVLPAFGAAGAYQSLVLRQFADRAGRLYAADLGGGALGALLAVAVLGPLGGPVNFGLVLALAVAGCAWMWPDGRGTARRWAPACFAIVLAAALLQAWNGWLDVSYDRAPDKLITRMLRPTPQGTPRLVAGLEHWDAYSRIDVLELAAPRGTQRLVFIDGETPTPMVEVGGLAPNAAGRGFGQALAALPCRLAAPADVLSIGSGGGYDVALALDYGARRIDAVELNPGVLSVVESAGDFSGNIYERPGVRLYHQEGRLFVRRAVDASYDLLFMALAQSLVGNLQEYALSENYLYTREAFSDYLRVLRPGGTLALLVSNPVVQQKLVVTARAVLEARGQPSGDCIVAVASRDEMPYAYLVLVRGEPFPAPQLQALADEIAAHGYTVLHVPGGVPGTHPLEEPVRIPDRRSKPATDEKPFFFHLESGTPVGLQLLLLVASLALLAAWAALAAVSANAPRMPAAAIGIGGYFVLLGLAFLMVEVLVLQRTIRIVGLPTLNLGLVLATFLVSAGCGSAASERVRSRFILRGVLVLLAVAVVGLLPLLGRFEPSLEGLPLGLRCLALAALLIPFGFLMGMPFPVGVRLLPTAMRPMVPWLWGLNGIASVVGSALVVAVVLESGFRMAMVLPASLYALAIFALVPFAPRSA